MHIWRKGTHQPLREDIEYVLPAAAESKFKCVSGSTQGRRGMRSRWRCESEEEMRLSWLAMHDGATTAFPACSKAMAASAGALKAIQKLHSA